MLKRLLTLAVLSVSAVLLSGCVSILSISSEQQDIVGKVRLTVTACATGFDNGDDPDPEDEDHPGCWVGLSNYKDAYPYPVDGAQYQVLFAIRVPVGTGVPQAISTTPGPAPPANGTITARRDAGYEAALQAVLPAGPGMQWAGYLSDPYDFGDGGDGVPAQSAQVVLDLTLPPTADGGPFIGPLQVRPVVGARRVLAGTWDADRAVDCGTNPFTSSDDLTVCVDSPTSADIDGVPFPVSTRDFGIVAGKATASPGQTVTLPFNVRGAGALPAGLTAALSAASKLPGVGDLKPSVTSAVLANGSNTRATVSVTIPKSSGPGAFDVTLTGRLDNGQTRTGVAKLTVRDRQKPVVTKLKAKPKRFKAATKRKPKRGTNVSFTLSEAAKLRLTVERCAKRKRGRCVRWATLKGGLTKPGVQGPNKIRFNGRLRGKALRAGGYRLVLKPTDGAGNVGKVVRAAFVVRG